MCESFGLRRPSKVCRSRRTPPAGIGRFPGDLLQLGRAGRMMAVGNVRADSSGVGPELTFRAGFALPDRERVG